MKTPTLQFVALCCVVVSAYAMTRVRRDHKPGHELPARCAEAPFESKPCPITTRFSYNRQTKLCEPFVDHGCGATSGNSFNSEKECINVCRGGDDYDHSVHDHDDVHDHHAHDHEHKGDHEHHEQHEHKGDHHDHD